MEMKKNFSFIIATTVVFTLLVAGCKFSNGVDIQRLKKDTANATNYGRSLVVRF